MRCGAGPLRMGSINVSSKVLGIGTLELNSRLVEVTVSLS